MQTEVSIDELGHHLRGILKRIHDHVYLQNHNLCTVFFPSPSLDAPGRGQRLRRMILEAVEQLSPPVSRSARSKEWRGYYVLTSHYIEGREPPEIMAELAISERQFYRDQREAIKALTYLLWEKLQWSGAQRAGEKPAEGTADSESPQTLRGEVERLSSQRGPVDLEELLEGVLEAIRPLADENMAQVSYRLGQRLPAVPLNRTVLRQVFIHLLGRCIVQLHTKSVDIELDCAGRSLEVKIIGLAPDSTAQEIASALHLEMLHSLLETVGGEWHGISVGPDRYRFHFLLPTTEPRVLLAVEDNPGAVQLLRRYLAQKGYQVIGAPNGGDALRLARELRPDIITLDIMLPRQDGWEILRALKADPATRSVPVLISSVLNETHVAFALGADAYLNKPFSQAQLLDKLKTLSDHPHGEGVQDAASLADNTPT